jgi:hypothetical protein
MASTSMNMEEEQLEEQQVYFDALNPVQKLRKILKYGRYKNTNLQEIR